MKKIIGNSNQHHKASKMSLKSPFNLFYQKNTTLPQEQKRLHKYPNRQKKISWVFVVPTWICWTSLNCSRTSLESPPAAASPHVTTKPSRLTAAKALQVDWIYLKKLELRQRETPVSIMWKNIWCFFICSLYGSTCFHWFSFCCCFCSLTFFASGDENSWEWWEQLITAMLCISLKIPDA